MIVSPDMFGRDPRPVSLSDALAARRPLLRSARLLLRAPRVADFALHAALLSGRRRSVQGGPLARGRERDDWLREVGTRLMRGQGVWTLETRASHRDPDLPTGQVAGFLLAGTGGDAGWVLAAEFDRRGLGPEAAARLADDAAARRVPVDALDPVRVRPRAPSGVAAFLRRFPRETPASAPRRPE